jgi:hypothetical protein
MELNLLIPSRNTPNNLPVQVYHYIAILSLEPVSRITCVGHIGFICAMNLRSYSIRKKDPLSIRTNYPNSNCKRHRYHPSYRAPVLVLITLVSENDTVVRYNMLGYYLI